MNKINLLPWREHEDKLKVKCFIIVWVSIFCLSLIFLFITKIIIIHQTKDYKLDNERILFRIKNIAAKVQEVKNLKYEENELKNIIKNIQINHQKIKKIVDLIDHLKYLITPDLFVRLIEFYPPFLCFIMHTNSKEEYIKFRKFLELNFDGKIQWLILNKFQSSQFDFIANILLKNISKKE